MKKWESSHQKELFSMARLEQVHCTVIIDIIIVLILNNRPFEL